MHEKIMERINAIRNHKQSEIDTDLKAALSAIVELFSSFPAFREEAQRLVVFTNNMLALLGSTDANTPHGQEVRVMTIAFLERVNPKLEGISRLVSDFSAAVVELRNNIESN